MPALADGDFAIADSSAIVQYLEAKHPGPALIPTQPRARALTIWYEEMADKVMMGWQQKMFYNRVVAPVFMKREGNGQVADRAERDELPPILDYLERTVPEAGFLIGANLTLADLAIASPLGNLPHMGCGIDDERYPRLAAYAARILERPSLRHPLERETAYLKKVGALAD
jgi:glutathione S-transferase